MSMLHGLWRWLLTQSVSFVFSSSTKCAALVLLIRDFCALIRIKVLRRFPQTLNAVRVRLLAVRGKCPTGAGAKRRGRRLTAGHSTSCSRTQNPRPCYWCRPSFCHRSLARTGSSWRPAARKTGCRRSLCRFPPRALPVKDKFVYFTFSIISPGFTGTDLFYDYIFFF